MPLPSHQRRNAAAARPYAARVFGLRMLTVKKSRKRFLAPFPAPAMIAGRPVPCPAVFLITPKSPMSDPTTGPPCYLGITTVMIDKKGRVSRYQGYHFPNYLA